ncbi:S1C family serine protease [Paenibacillus radicis (ex Xue et al. 2023)]|uniref:Trypsin-like peptidase domain-containing protein n=1 Tax=Paenibacillus radicis (ex Xue et al. 2023) TaxID=2972489 RepID=A0ABT1YNU9_9BACL|nr:trypsin-like peptidase domain-containing protein [Paenibacillus radicis (ex Xue et al. 2023)]MCR8634846.1 trypsin-like peptidase domain-containing protein [Paenibacillus radicis (ex Xue et al. 2023)]
MSLFDDDFYSTKVSRKMEWSAGGSRIGQGIRGQLPGWLLPALGGAVVTLGLVVMFGTGGSGNAGMSLAASSASAGAPGIKPDAQQLSSDSVVRAAEKVGPTVISIIGSHKEGEKENARGGSMGLGSGVMFQKVGDKIRIVTNNHVVEGFGQLDVVTTTGERKKATLVGRDQMTDLAVLEVDGAGIKVLAEFGDSDTLKAGETAIAVGNPLGLGYAPTVTKGIISWPKRVIPVSLGQQGDFDWEMEVIQTDAAINQGNSGGALVNLEGKVVGINTLKVADMGVEGLGFAIPINSVKQIIEGLITDHKIKRPYLGVVTQDLQSFTGTEVLKLPTNVKTGIIVLDVTGPAKEAGLKTNDVIVELDSKPVNSTMELRKYIYSQKKIGDKIVVTYYRGGKKATVTLTTAELKDR